MDHIDIERLVPQRAPILMVDSLDSFDDDTATTSLAIRTANFFIDSDGLMVEAGLIEHMAQSASATAGYDALRQGVKTPPVGYIGEVKNFCCYRRPTIGEKLTTIVNKGPEAGGITIVKCKTCIGNETIAETQLKIFIDGNK